MSDPKRIAAPPVPSAFWLTTKFTDDDYNATCRRFAERVACIGAELYMQILGGFVRSVSVH